MLPPWFALLPLIQLSGATVTNTTTIEYPSCDVTSCDYRSLWSLLESCALTLFICVWHAIHPAVPLPHYKWFNIFLYRLSLMLVAFSAPEIVIVAAFTEWSKAKEITRHALASGYEWWTMTHSHFVIMGGFALCNYKGVEEIDVDKYMSLVETGKIVNPAIVKADIKDKSTSDGLGKAIRIVLLFWFVAQVVVRYFSHLTVTLIELDTLCMTLLTFPLIFFWWDKPRCPERPHIFYTRSTDTLHSWRKLQRSNYLGKLLDNIRTDRSKLELFSPATAHPSSVIPFYLTWTTFGAFHAIAWNYDFPTEIEKTIWRVSSLTLAGTPAIFAVVNIAQRDSDNNEVSCWMDRLLSRLQVLLLVIGVICRLLLVGLMFASLRALPLSAYITISWTNYIPHL